MTALALVLVLTAADGTGTAGMPLLKVGQGPRGSALGESYTSLAADASAIYWNPAGLARVRGYQFALSHQQWFTGVADEVGQGAFAIGPGTAGVGLVYSGDRDFEGWSQENEPEGRFSTWSAVLSAGYGMTLFGKYDAGVAVKGLLDDLAADRGSGAAVDFGVQARPLANLGVGLAARHLGFVSYGSGPGKLPAEFALGADYRYEGFVGTADVVVPLDNYPSVRLGVEYSPIREAALRVGWRSGLSDVGLLGGLTAGLGVTVGSFGLDYAFAPYGDLGLTHRIGLRYVPEPPRFGSLTLSIVDAATKLPLEAYVALAGVIDTAATATGMRFTGLGPGIIAVRVVKGGYDLKEDTLRIVAGREAAVTLALARVRYGTIDGGIYDAGTKAAIGGRVVYRGILYGDEQVAAKPGTFQLRNLPAGQYRMGVMGPSEDYIPQSCTIDVAAGKTVKRDFYIARKRQTIVLDGVNFVTGKADILPEFAPVLDRAGTILKQSPTIKVELAGHTDPREINTREFPDNWKLSQARADAVRAYLIDKFGIEPERLTARGYADTQPVAPNTTEEGMAKNRRTEFRILEQ
jgi:outer membrane protein OmpA-like peptidoglycan-associated protein